MVRGKVLVTGAGGYLGSRLSLYLSNIGFDVIALCNSTIPDNYEWIKSIYLIIQGDLRDKNTLNKIEKLKPDYIIHLVSLDHYHSEISITDTIQVNVQTTWELLEISKKIEIKKFLYFSTIHVYGNNTIDDFTENVALIPKNAYGLTHLLSEKIVDYYNNSFNLNSASFRLSNSYGEPVFSESNCWDLALNFMYKSAFFEKKIILKSDGSSLRDFIHYSSICSAIRNVLECNFNLEGVYNLCEGTSIRILDLAFIVREIFINRFNENLEIYINNTDRVDVVPQILLNQKSFSNRKLNSVFDVEYLSLNSGINLIFDYFEQK